MVNVFNTSPRQQYRDCVMDGVGGVSVLKSVHVWIDEAKGRNSTS